MCYECGRPASWTGDIGAGTCHVCREFYCHQHYNKFIGRCDRCALDPAWGQAHNLHRPPDSNIGCYIILTILCLVPIVILAIMLHLSQGATQAEIRDAGDPLSNTFFLVLAGLATLAFLFILGSLMSITGRFGRLVVLIIFGVLAVVGVTLTLQAHQRYLDVTSTSTSTSTCYYWCDL